MSPSPLLAAKKSAKAAPEDAELEELRGELRRLSGPLAAQKGAMPKADTKVPTWEAKEDVLRAQRDEVGVAMAVFSLGKAREKVKEKEAMQQLGGRVQRMEEIVAAEAKVKVEEVEDEVVVVEAEVEETVDETVKEEVEEKVVEEKAVEGGQLLRVFFGTRDVGAIHAMTGHGTRPSWLAFTPQTCTTPSSSPRRVRFGLSVFCCNGCIQGFWGRGGGSGWTRGGGGPPGQAPARRGVVGWWGWQLELPGRKWGGAPPPPPRKGSEDV